MRGKLIVAEVLLVVGLLMPSPVYAKCDVNTGGKNSIPVTGWAGWAEQAGWAGREVAPVVVAPPSVPGTPSAQTSEKEQGRQPGPLGPNGQGQGEPKVERKGGEG